MESESNEKGKRRKLKRVVPKRKKAKVNLNASGGVPYYKKVKAVLNASLNTSRASQMLKANNKALAQSLQHVKQELRLSLNENARLRVETQDLSMKLLRAEKQLSLALGQDNNGYQQRLQGLKALLNTMSHHLLELGTCVHDGMDLCLVSPRSSQSPSSRPQSLEDFCSPAEDILGGMDLPSPHQEAGGKAAEEQVLQQGTDVGSGRSAISSNKAAPTLDMSIIMEQSVLLADDAAVLPPDTHMDTVPEDPLHSKTVVSKKAPAVRKPPQRVLHGANTLLSSSAGTGTTQKKWHPDNSGAQQHAEQRSRAGGAARAGSPVACRETSVKGKAVQDVLAEVEMPSSGSVKDVTMADPVSSSPPAQKAQAEKLPIAELPAEQTSVKRKPGSESKMATVLASVKERKKSLGRKKDAGVAQKGKGVSTSLQPSRVSPPLDKDTADLPIANSCDLRGAQSSGDNLEAVPSDNPHPQVSSVEQFLAEIRESVRNSTRLESLLGADFSEAVQIPQKSTDKLGDSEKNYKLTEASFDFESEGPEHTIYFNSDMDFTQVLPQAVSVQKASKKGETRTQSKSKEKVATGKQSAKTDQTSKADHRSVSNGSQAASKDDGQAQTDKSGSGGSSETLRRSARSKGRVQKTYTEDGVSDNEDVQEKEKEGARSRSRVRKHEEDNASKAIDGEDKRPAVALRLNKPGQMVFAVSRKEEDGSRKAIPAKLPSKARSKSKKQVEEMLKNLPQKEPEGIFDFHDQTPRPAGSNEAASQKPSSVFDLSLDDTMHGTAASLADFREKIGALAKGKQLYCGDPAELADGDKDCDSAKGGEVPLPSLLGDAPEYHVPLKDDTSSNEPEPSSYSGDHSTSKSSGRRTRSRSRSRKDGQEEVENSAPAQQKTRGRSRSRQRSEKQASGEIDAGAGDGESEKNQASPENRKTSSARSSDTCDDDHKEKPRQSARSRARKSYAEANPSDEETSPVKNRSGRARSRKRVENEDEEYQPPHSGASQQRGRSRSRRHMDEVNDNNDQALVSSESAQPRGRSRRRKSVSNEDDASDTQKQRGRSRSRRRVNKDDDSEKKNEGQAVHGSPKSQDSTRETGDPIKTHKPEDESHALVPDRKSLKMVTDRRQRSKSSHRKLYSDTDMFDDPFGFSEKTGESQQNPQVASGTEKKARHRTRSRGNVLLNDEEKQSTENPEVSPTRKSTSPRPENIPEKRKPSENSDSSGSGERHVSPCKKVRKSLPSKENISLPVSESQAGADSSTSDSRTKGASVTTSSPGVKKTKSSLPIAGKRIEEKGQASHISVSGKAKVPEQKAEKKDMSLQFEELKLKLKTLAASCPSPGDTSSQPIKKSRPLVLATTHVAANQASKSKKSSGQSLPAGDESNTKAVTQPAKNSQPTGDKLAGKKAAKSQPGSPRPKSPSRVATSLRLSAGHASLDHVEDGDSQPMEGRRGRRAASSVCYKEPSLNAKLRRGDLHTSFLYEGEQIQIYKSAKGHGKRPRSSDHGALHDISNLPIAEVEAEGE